MTTRRLSRALFVVVPFAAAAAVACGGSDSGASLFADETPDAGPTASYDSGTLSTGQDSSVPLATSCAPAPLPASFQPTWRPPAGQRTGVCTAQQTSDFYDACLTPPIDSLTCANYVSANQACTSCLQSDDTDTTYGPVIWHSNRAFFTLNIPGCLAIVEGDATKTSCGATYQAVLECKETVCTACFAGNNGSFNRFATCENSASSECNAYQTALNETCDPNMHDANDPDSTCVPPSTTPAKTVYETFAPLFCGK